MERSGVEGWRYVVRPDTSHGLGARTDWAGVALPVPEEGRATAMARLGGTLLFRAERVLCCCISEGVLHPRLCAVLLHRAGGDSWRHRS